MCPVEQMGLAYVTGTGCGCRLFLLWKKVRGIIGARVSGGAGGRVLRVFVCLLCAGDGGEADGLIVRARLCLWEATS